LNAPLELGQGLTCIGIHQDVHPRWYGLHRPIRHRFYNYPICPVPDHPPDRSVVDRFWPVGIGLKGTCG